MRMRDRTGVSIALRSRFALVAAPGGAITQAEVDALRARINAPA